MQQFKDGSSTTPILEIEFCKRKKAVGTNWRMDETYFKVKGKWCYLYRAVDTEGKTIDFLLTKNRDKLAAKRFLIKSNRLNFFAVLQFICNNIGVLAAYGTGIPVT